MLDASNIESAYSNEVVKTAQSTADTTAPVVSAFSAPATATALTVTGLSVTASDNVGVTGYLINDSATAPAASASGWAASAPSSYTFATAGTKTLYAWAKDTAGNVSAGRSASITITLADTTAPVVTGFSIPATAYSKTVSISLLTATDNVAVTGYLVNESAAAPSASASGWSASAPASYTFAAAGAKTLYAWAKDAAGNVSASRSAKITITVSKQILGSFHKGSWKLSLNQSNSMMAGITADEAFQFGMEGDIPVVGDWNGDGQSKIGVYRDGAWYLDYNNNGQWDGCGAPQDPSKDLCAVYGMKDDVPVVGKWDGGITDMIGVFRNGSWFLDYKGTKQWVGCGAPEDSQKDLCAVYGKRGDIPVAGDWNGDGISKIGVFRNGSWFLDYKGTKQWIGCGAPENANKDFCAGYGMNGDTPVVGDWNGDGISKIGVFRNGYVYLDMNNNGIWDGLAVDHGAGIPQNAMQGVLPIVLQSAPQ
ncbi:MAG TPA: hypothetical protein VLH56_09805 [Dissulfurispiraceae bacterium]|nr:hypothetical protein [Dissulfurispiraceae bacterium]